jgi:hypothetical protein
VQVLYLQQELAKQQTLEQQRFKQALEKQRLETQMAASEKVTENRQVHYQTNIEFRKQCFGAGAGAESRGAEIKLTTGTRAKITNCGSGSFLFTADLKKFDRKKLWLLKKFLEIVTSQNYLTVTAR